MTIDPQYIRASDAIDLLTEWSGMSTRASADTAIELLRTLAPSEPLALVDADSKALRKVYRRRVAAGHTDVLGAAELLEALDRLDDINLASTAASIAGRVVVIWLDTDLSRIIGCTVGIDRRAKESDSVPC